MKIAEKHVGQGNKCFIIAEVAQAHDGSLGAAHAFIDAAAKCGVDAIKFQTHIATAESTKDETFRIQMRGQDATRYDYWKRMEFTQEQWVALAAHAKEKDIIFLSSAFSVEAVKLLKEIGMPAWKVGSGEFCSNELLQAMMDTKKPILFSTGMSRYEEINAAIEIFKKENADFALFQCTTQYPTPLENVGLNVLEEYKSRYNCPVGLSDHSGSMHPALAAIAQGADLIELHVTFDKQMYGPDTIASVTFDELSFICEAAETIHLMNQNPVNKDDMADKLADMRRLFTKSIALVSPQKAGTVLTQDMLTPKKPGTGIPYTDKNEVIGLTLKQDVSYDRLLNWKDINCGKT